MHPETNTPVLHLKTELPPDLNLEALSRNFDRTSKDASSRSCQIVPTGELNGGPDTLLKALNSWCSTHLGVPSPGWNALQITEVKSSERSFDIPESSPFCLLQYGGSDTLQIFPDTKSAKPHNLLLEIPMGPISTILVSSSIAAGSTISSTRIPGSVGSNTPTFQVIPIRTPEAPAPQALGNHVRVQSSSSGAQSVLPIDGIKVTVSKADIEEKQNEVARAVQMRHTNTRNDTLATKGELANEPGSHRKKEGTN